MRSLSGLTRDESSRQATIFFLASFETTASTMSMVMYLLTVYPDVQQRVFDEIQEHLDDEVDIQSHYWCGPNRAHSFWNE